MTLEEYEQADETALHAVRERVSASFKAAGAHFVIDTVADLLPVLSAIEQRLALGQRP